MCEKRKILLITASLSEDALSTRIASEFAHSAALSGDGGIVERIDLSKANLPRMSKRMIDAFANGTEQGDCPDVVSLVDSFLSADVYVIAVPNYNKLTSSEVVDLLNLLSLDERVYGRGSQTGKLGNKRAVVIMTSGQDSLSGDDYSFGSRYVESVLSQFGIMDIIVERVDDTDNDKGKKKLEAALCELRDIASDYLIY